MSRISEADRNRAIGLFNRTQDLLITAFERVDGAAKVKRTSWDRPGGGGGTMGVIRGDVVEKAGANVSIVHGDSFPGGQGAHAGKPFFAAGVSTITHMYNPFAPIGHMNVRLIEVGDTFWVGGGGDLTPFKPFEEDTREFHESLRAACDAFGADTYQKYSKWCDEYFYIKHRQSPRGVGGIFFDHLEGDFSQLFDFIESVAMAFATTFPQILERRKSMPFSDDDKEQQLYWRGRYAEFNLAYDRGTKFGLESGGNNDAIFVSMPPVVKW